MGATIFISVTSFCDPHLRFTLDGLFAQANDRARLHVAVIDQSLDATSDWIAAQPWAGQVQYLQIDPVYSRGVSWARSVAFSLYRDEDFLLEIDSHTLFDPGWDDVLIGELAFLHGITPRAILTTYPPPFEFDEGGQPFKTIVPAGTVLWLQPNADQTLHDNDLTLTFHTDHVFDADFVVGHHIAGGFLFASGDFIHDVPYDPYMYFHGEEQNVALRAFTRGWTIFNPKHDNIPLCHLYRAAGVAHPTQHWQEDLERRRVIKRTELEERARRRLCALVAGERGDQPFGLGSRATLADFANQSGIDYIERRITAVTPARIRR